MNLAAYIIIAVHLFAPALAYFTVGILHTNDIHSRIEETDKYGSMCSSKQKLAKQCFGGLARLSTKIEEIRNFGKNVLLLDGGDQQTGTIWYDAWQGNATAKILNELKYDAMVLGNHDFDGGVQHVIKYLEMLNTSVVMSNVATKDEPSWPSKRLFKTSLVIQSGKEKIGICGYVLTTTPRVSNPGPNIKFSDEVEAVRTCAKTLVSAGINKIIALGHSGIEMDKRIAKEVGDVDIVVGGHTNTFLYTGKPPSNDVPYGPYPLVMKKKDGRRSIIVQDFAYGKYLGYLNVTFDINGHVKSWLGNPILLGSNVQQDSRILAKVASMKTPVDKIGKVEIGKTRIFLDGDRSSCRFGECILGNLMTDAAVYNSAVNNNNNSRWTNASIALWTSNSIISSIDITKTDFIRYENIRSSFPFSNKLDIVAVKGNVLIDALERSASFYKDKNPNGANLQVAGLILTFDLSKPVGQRLTRIQARCADCRVPKYEELQKDKIYKVIVSSYMAKGGGGYGLLKTKSISHYAGATTDIEAIEAYIKARSPLIIDTGSRINIIRSSLKVNSGSENYKLYSALLLTASLLSILNVMLN